MLSLKRKKENKSKAKNLFRSLQAQSKNKKKQSLNQKRITIKCI